MIWLSTMCTSKYRLGVFVISLFFVPATMAQTELYFPQAIRGNDNNTTEIFVQNSDSGAVSVTVRFFTFDGTLRETQNAALQPNGGTKFRLGDPTIDPFTVGCTRF
jgi:hypothetical protein